MLGKIALLVMRIGTGMLVVLWGGVRLLGEGMGPTLAHKYYGGLGADSTLQLAYGGRGARVDCPAQLGHAGARQLLAQEALRMRKGE